MTMKKIPDYTGNAAEELKILGRFENPVSLHEQIEALITHDDNEERVSCVMDWAFQIRETEELTLSQAIDAAMILYYG